MGILLCSYSGARKAEPMLDFIKQKIEEDKGFARVDILDSLAQQFRSAPDLSTVLSQLTEKAGTLTDEAQKSAGELYVKYGQKAAEKVCSLQRCGPHRPHYDVKRAAFILSRTALNIFNSFLLISK